MPPDVPTPPAKPAKIHIPWPTIALILLVGIVIFGAGTVLFLNLGQKETAGDSTQGKRGALPSTESMTQQITKESTGSQLAQPTATSSDQPPLLLKSIGIDLGSFDPATNRAGDLLFTRAQLVFGRLWMDYAFTIPGSQSASGQDKRNPQPTFIVPAGTKIKALVDGVVLEVPKLYSNDYSVMIGTGEPKSPWRYELEHVVNPLVKVGDRVTAGQVIAEAANFNNNAPDGFGIFEIGILKGGNPPQHICPFAYLDPSIKDTTLAQIRAFYAAWETFTGNTALYDEPGMPIPGCQTLDPING